MTVTVRQGDTWKTGVEIIAHRGANREAPENTLPAFQRALDIGVQGIELDVHVTRDNVPLVHHDAVLPDGGRIERMESADVERRTDAPTLSRVLELVDGRCLLYLEIKAAAAVVPCVELLKELTGWCFVHSFDHRIALVARSLLPELKTGILLVSRLVDSAHAFHSARATDVWQHADYIDRELVAEAHKGGARVIVWTVNDVSYARELKAIGVDGICTDTPRELLARLSDRAP